MRGDKEVRSVNGGRNAHSIALILFRTSPAWEEEYELKLILIGEFTVGMHHAFCDNF